MTVQTQVIRFQKSTGANGTTQDVNLNFTPKAIILTSQGGTVDASAEAHYSQTIGFSDGTNHAAICIASEDAAAVSDSTRVHDPNHVWLKITPDPQAFESYGTCAFSTNKVTFTWVANSAVADLITIWAIGGSDITNVKVNTVDIGRTTVGTQDYTGLGFNPSDTHTALFTIAGNVTGTGITNTGIANFGCVTKTITTDAVNQWYITTVTEDNSDPSDTWRVSGNDRNIAVLSITGAFAHYATLSAWITDGFRLSWDGPPSGTTLKFSYLAINGGNWDSGTLTAPTTATNNVNYAVSVGSNPIRGLMVAGVGTTTTATIGTEAIFSIGTTDGTTHSVISAIDEDAQATMDSYRYAETTSIVYLMGANGALTDRATFNSFTTNNFRLDWATKNATAAKYHWVVVADAQTSQLYDRPISETTVTIGTETTTRLLFLPRPISETSVTVGTGAVTRLLFLPRTIAEGAITVGTGAVTRLQQLVRAISESSISTTGTVTILQSLIKTIAEGAVTVGAGAATGAKQATKTVAETAVTVGAETVTRLQQLVRAISETAVTVGADTISRLQQLIKTIAEGTVSVGPGSVSVNKLLIKTIAETAVSVGADVVSRLQQLTRTIAEGTVTVGADSITRIQSVTKAITETAVTVGPGSVSIAKSIVKTVAEGAVSVGAGAVIRIQQLTRAISEGAVNVGTDTITRVQSVTKTIAETAVTVGAGSVLAGKLLVTEVRETLTKWYYSVVTRKIGG